MNSATRQLTVLADESTSPLFAAPPEVFGVVEGPDGAVYFCDVSNHRIFRIDPTSEAITAIVGSGEPGNAGDGDPADAALVTQPYELRFDQAGNLFFVDMQAQVVRRVDHETRLIATVAGDGSEGFGGDEGAATRAQLAKPHSIELSGDTLYIAYYNAGLRVIDISGELLGDLYRQGREIGYFLADDPQGFKPNARRTWGTMTHKGNIFFTDNNSGLWAVRLKPSVDGTGDSE